MGMVIQGGIIIFNYNYLVQNELDNNHFQGILATDYNGVIVYCNNFFSNVIKKKSTKYWELTLTK